MTGPLRARDPKHRKASTNGRAPRGPAVRTFLAPLDLLDSVVTYANSWGTGWGDHGYLRMRLRTSEALDGVDLKQLVV